MFQLGSVDFQVEAREVGCQIIDDADFSNGDPSLLVDDLDEGEKYERGDGKEISLMMLFNF